jgi:hypothetical protein
MHMAKIELDPLYEDEAAQFLMTFEEKDVLLSDHAKGLLRLSAEAWFEDLPASRFRADAEFDKRKLAHEIVQDAINDPHIKSSGRARYTDLMAALVASGKKKLSELFDKGF